MSAKRTVRPVPALSALMLAGINDVATSETRHIRARVSLIAA